MRVVVVYIEVEDAFEVAASDDQHPVQALSTHRADEAFRVGIGTGCLDGGAEDSQAFGSEHLVEGGAELGVAVADEETSSTDPHAHYEVAGLLDDPRTAWVRGHSGEVDPSGVEFDKEQHVEATQPHGLDREEIDREDAGCLSAQELRPARSRTPRRRIETVLAQDAPDGGCRHAESEAGELTLD